MGCFAFINSLGQLVFSTADPDEYHAYPKPGYYGPNTVPYMDFSYNAQGKVTETAQRAYVGYKGNKYLYDENGFLICKAYIDGSYVNEDILEQGFYSASNQNIAHTWYINDPLTGTPLRSFQKNYTVENGQLTQTTPPENNTTYNVFGSSRIGFLQNNTYNYEIKDHRGTVRAVLTKGATLQSSLIQYADYLPLGGKMNGRQYQNTGAQLSLGYQGEWATDETAKIGLIDFDLRQYDATIGRWNNIDPYRQYASGFVGMGNDWVNIIDPTGGYGGGANGGTPKYTETKSYRMPKEQAPNNNTNFMMMRYTKAMTDLQISMDHLGSSIRSMEASWDRAITNGLKSLGAGYNDPDAMTIQVNGQLMGFNLSLGLGTAYNSNWGFYYNVGGSFSLTSRLIGLNGGVNALYSFDRTKTSYDDLVLGYGLGGTFSTPKLGISAGLIGDTKEIRSMKPLGKSLGVTIPSPFIYKSLGKSFDGGGGMNYSGSIVKF